MKDSVCFFSEKLVSSSGVDLFARAKDLECGKSRSRFLVQRGTPKRNSNFETGSRFAAMRTITSPPAGYDRATRRDDLKSLGAKRLVSATISLHTFDTRYERSIRSYVRHAIGSRRMRRGWARWAIRGHMTRLAAQAAAEEGDKRVGESTASL